MIFNILYLYLHRDLNPDGRGPPDSESGLYYQFSAWRCYMYPWWDSNPHSEEVRPKRTAPASYATEVLKSPFITATALLWNYPMVCHLPMCIRRSGHFRGSWFLVRYVTINHFSRGFLCVCRDRRGIRTPESRVLQTVPLNHSGIRSKFDVVVGVEPIISGL